MAKTSLLPLMRARPKNVATLMSSGLLRKLRQDIVRYVRELDTQ